MKVEGAPAGALLGQPRGLRAWAGRAADWAAGNPQLALGLMVLLAAVLAVIKLGLDRPSFEFNWENRWWQIALNVSRGEGYVACKEIYFPFCGPDNQVTAMREPLPVLLYAAIARLTAESLLAAAVAGVAANLALIIAVYYLAREVAGVKTALAAALMWTLYLAPVRLFYSQLSGDLLATLATTVSFVFFMRALRVGRPAFWLAAGVALGVAILSRSALLAVALALTAGLVVWPGRERLGGTAGRLWPAALFAVAWLVTMSPWVIRNGLVFGRPVVGSTLAGYYLLRQNHMLQEATYLRFVSGGEFAPVLEEIIAWRGDLDGDENEAEMDAVYRQEALAIIAAEPGRYLALSAYRFLMLWFNWGVNEVYGKTNTAGDYLILVQHALLLMAGVAGLAGRWRQAWPLAAAVAAFSLLCMAVMAHLPYVVPAVAPLVVLAALGMGRVFGMMAQRNQRG
jgi:hypothetical protein